MSRYTVNIWCDGTDHGRNGTKKDKGFSQTFDTLDEAKACFDVLSLADSTISYDFNEDPFKELVDADDYEPVEVYYFAEAE